MIIRNRRALVLFAVVLLTVACDDEPDLSRPAESARPCVGEALCHSGDAGEVKVMESKGHSSTVQTANPDPEQSRPCRPDKERSYGDTPLARRLRDLLIENGAPGGYRVTTEHVRDTGTALLIDIPAYERQVTMYATLLSRPFPENEDWQGPEREIGRRGDFVIFITTGDFAWQSFTARSEEWQLSLLAYPASDNQKVAWPDGVRDWLDYAIANLESSAPSC